MQQLFIEDNPTEIFFNSGVNLKSICEWINASFSNMENLFKLNEPYTCNAKIDDSYTDNKIIQIFGEDDFIRFEIKEIEPVEL